MEHGHRARLPFVDALRGLAFVFMALNHTAGAFLGGPLRAHQNDAVYLTVTLAAPLFLLLVGFSMALSHVDRAGRPKRFRQYLTRGLLLLALGYAVTATTRPDTPVFTGGVLQTIAICLICLAPFLRFMTRQSFPYVLLAVAAALYAAFVAIYPIAMARLAATPLLLQLFFNGFPPWPWIGLVMTGLALGARWAGAAAEKGSLVRRIGEVGGFCLVFYFLSGYLAGHSMAVNFGRDFIVNGHWLPAPLTIFWILGGVLVNFAVVYWLVEIVGLPMRWLRSIGRSALLLYITHLLLIRVVGQRLLELAPQSWWQFAVINLALLASMLFVAYGVAMWRRFRVAAMPGDLPQNDA